MRSMRIARSCWAHSLRRTLVVLSAVLTLGCCFTSVAAAGGSLSWSEPVTISSADNSLSALSCPSTELCVAADDAGNILTTHKPAATMGLWETTKVGQSAISAVSCPTERLCVAVDTAGDVITSSKPTAGADSWTVTNVDGSNQIFDVSCATGNWKTLCVAVDRAGNVLTSTNPTGGADAWSVTSVESERFIFTVSCPSVHLCVAVGAGIVLTSTDPTGGVGDWTVSTIDHGNYIQGLSCPTEKLCVAGEAGGNVLTSTNPTGGSTAWVVTPLGHGNSLFSVACPTEALCVAIGNDGNIVTSTEPLEGPDAWFLTELKNEPTKFSGGYYPLTEVSCPSGELCIVLDGKGQVVVGTYSNMPPPSEPRVPINQQPPAIAGIPAMGQTLTAVPGTWFNSPTERSYQWVLCSGEHHTGGGGCEKAPGNVTEPSYEITAATFSRGEEFRIAVIESARNAEGEGVPAWSGWTTNVQAQPILCKVPRLQGKTIGRAREVLERNNCLLGKVTEPKHHSKHMVVVSQRPGSGRILPAGTRIAIKLGWQ